MALNPTMVPVFFQMEDVSKKMMDGVGNGEKEN
jgi:hypothetical protein